MRSRWPSGVALGIAVADLLLLAIEVGVLQVALVIVLAMAVAVLFGGGTLLVNQAAISALLVVVLQPTARVSRRDVLLPR